MMYHVPLLGELPEAAHPAAGGGGSGGGAPGADGAAGEREGAATAARRALLWAAERASAAAVRAAPTLGGAEPLSPSLVVALTARHPLHLTKAWPPDPGAAATAADVGGPPATAAGGPPLPAGSTEFLSDESSAVLSLHWYDAASLSVVARDGLTTRLLVLDHGTLGVIEQVCFCSLQPEHDQAGQML